MTRLFAYPNVDLSIMDRIVAAAERHGQYVAPTLTEGGGECGIAQLDDAWYNGGYRSGYFDHIRRIVPRYKDSQAIGFWELVNEPNGSSGNLKTSYRESSDLIKSLDANHLVGTGAHAAWSGGEAKYTSDHDVPNIDLISMHEYDAPTGLSHWYDESGRAARALNKPWYAGEDGFCCNGGNTGSYSGNAAKLRDEWNAYLTEPECAGMLYWDFKLGHPEPTTVKFDTALWDLAKAYRHAYNGGATPPPGGLLSQGRPATASSLEGADLPASAAVDGNTGTRWSSQFSDPQWFQVDLGATYSINRVVLTWETAHARAYQIETSTDGTTWTSVHSTTTGDGSVDDLTVTGAGRYVRMYGTARGTEYGYSLFEFQVYGGGSAEPPPPATAVVNDNTTGTNNGQFQYSSSGWQYDSGSAGKYQNDDHYSSAVNADVLFRFDGTQVEFFGACCRTGPRSSSRSPSHPRIGPSTSIRSPRLTL